MRASLIIAIGAFVASLASFGSGIIPIITAAASVGWITFVLRRFDRMETIAVEEVEKDV